MAERDCKRNFKWPSMQRWQVSVVKKPKLKISVFEITNINVKCILDQTKLFRIPLWIYKSSSAILALKVTFNYVYSPFYYKGHLLVSLDGINSTEVPTLLKKGPPPPSPPCILCVNNVPHPVNGEEKFSVWMFPLVEFSILPWLYYTNNWSYITQIMLGCITFLSLLWLHLVIFFHRQFRI